MGITYPPELLPRLGIDDEPGVVIVVGGLGVCPTARHPNLRGLRVLRGALGAPLEEARDGEFEIRISEADDT
jgi:hypothetical protein